jgi:hypothetical protein
LPSDLLGCFRTYVPCLSSGESLRKGTDEIRGGDPLAPERGSFDFLFASFTKILDFF